MIGFPFLEMDAGKLVVSVIIPTFNKLELTRQCLAAIRTNTSRELYEILVVDNGSTDGTAEFLLEEQAAGRLKAVLNDKNLGFARACNQGAAAAAAKYVLFLNNDAEVSSGWLQPLVQTAEKDPRVGGVGSKLLFPDSTIQHAGVMIIDARALGDSLLARHIFYRSPHDLPTANVPMTYQALTAACLLVPKALFDSLGGFDEAYWNGYEDVDLCFRISASDRLLIYQPESVAVHHESQSGSERSRKTKENIARLHQKWLHRVKPDFVLGPDQKLKPTDANRIHS